MHVENCRQKDQELRKCDPPPCATLWPRWLMPEGRHYRSVSNVTWQPAGWGCSLQPAVWGCRGTPHCSPAVWGSEFTLPPRSGGIWNQARVGGQAKLQGAHAGGPSPPVMAPGLFGKDATKNAG